jgi:adenine deaminase
MVEQPRNSLPDTRALAGCAMGRIAADLVIRNGRWVCVQSGEIVDRTDIAVLGDRIAYVGPDASHTIGDGTKVIDANGSFLVPGLLDAHMHVESGMLTVTEFVRAIISHGTTGIFIDPHEIANVFGLKGVKLMADEAVQQPIHVWVQVPSCVPSDSRFESAGSELGPEDIAEALTWPGVIGLGEVMNFPGVMNGDEKMHAEMAATRSAGRVIGGHYASPDLGIPFHGYAAGGPEDDHEGTRLEDAVSRVRQGMKLMMRYGSAWHDVAAQVQAVTQMGLDPRHFLLCTDDSHSQTLFNEGHMDRVIRHAISQGLSPITAIQMATLNTAEHFGVARDIGQIAPGRYADILIVNSLVDFAPETVIAMGRIISKSGYILVDLPEPVYPDWATHSVHLPHPMKAEDFVIRAEKKDSARCNVIGIIENQAPTRHLSMDMPVRDGQIVCGLESGVAKIALIERHHGSGRVVLGLVHGFGFTEKCAVATTVAHDCHQMIIVGTDDASMAEAANDLEKCCGGQAVVINGEVRARVELPLAGLMSNEPGQTVARKAANVLAGFRECGCMLNNPNMQLSLLALVVIPELRISDRGIIDVTEQKIIPLFE